MARSRDTITDDAFDEPDTNNVGDFVLARRMKDIGTYKADDAPPVSLYFQETTLKTGPVWTEGFWDGDKEQWWTAFGFLGTPIAWAPVPKTPEDWA